MRLTGSAGSGLPGLAAAFRHFSQNGLFLKKVRFDRPPRSGKRNLRFHLHLVQFQILNRQPFDTALFNRTQELVFTGPPVPPAPNERGWKDTVRSEAGKVTRIIVRFGPYTGRYVWHCHLLEHEDYDMMRPLEVFSKKDKPQPDE